MSSSGSLAIKCVSLSNKLCMARPTLNSLNPVDLNYYLSLISLDKCNRINNAVQDISIKICVPSGTKDVHFKVFHMITRTNEAKTLVKYTLWDCKCKFKSTTCNSNQRWNNQTCQCECKKLTRAQRIIVGIQVHVIKLRLLNYY